MAKLKTYGFENGTEVEVEQVHPLVIQKILNDGKPIRPKIPIERLILKGGSIQERPNPTQEDYVIAKTEFDLAVEEHNTVQYYQMLRFILVFAMRRPETDHYQEFVKRYGGFESDPDELQYMYMSQQLDGMDEVQRLFNFVLGQTTATEEGIEESTELFPAGSEDGEEGDTPAELPDGEQEEAGG